MSLIWNCTYFDNLSNKDLYQILQLRSDVFVLEQQCLYQDMDNKDLESWHLMGRNEEGILIAYARLLPAGLAYNHSSIGRIVTHPKWRRTGLGRALVAEAIQQSSQLFGKQTIQIGAQYYLLSFYHSFGFTAISDIYMEDGIEHILMIRKA